MVGYAEAGQFLGQPLGIAVEDVSQKEFGADGEQLRAHAALWGSLLF